MGKPMGNGLPISGVVFRPEVSEEFGRSVRYFNTFAGSSIPVAAGAAVLDVFEEENVQQRVRSEEHTSELQSRQYLVCRLLLEKKKNSYDQFPQSHISYLII